jgi:hypothetical protein
LNKGQHELNPKRKKQQHFGFATGTVESLSKEKRTPGKASSTQLQNSFRHRCLISPMLSGSGSVVVEALSASANSTSFRTWSWQWLKQYFGALSRL